MRNLGSVLGWEHWLCRYELWRHETHMLGPSDLRLERPLWLLLVAIQLLRSLARAACRKLCNLFAFWRWSGTSTWAPAALNVPVVLIPGNMQQPPLATAAALQASGIRAIGANLGPVSSSHDRACELFHALKGGRVDYGARHSAQHGHSRYGATVAQPHHPEWSEARPVVLLCHSQGANTALALLELLASGAFEGHATSAGWVVGVCTIASPLQGVPWLHTLPLMCVPHPTEKCAGQREEEAKAASGGGCGCPPEHAAMPVGHGAVGVSIALGYVLHILLSWSATFRDRVWDWRLEQWGLGVRDLPALLSWRHTLLHTTDTALYELTPAGARARGRRLRTYPAVYYVAVPCQITTGAERLALPSSRVAPAYVCTAALGAASSPMEDCRHSDGLVPTCAQRHPPGQPSARLLELTPPSTDGREWLDDPEECRRRRVALSERLQPGTWCSGGAMSVDHGSSRLSVGSPTLDYALRVLLPAMCDARVRSGSSSPTPLRPPDQRKREGLPFSE